MRPARAGAAVEVHADQAGHVVRTRVPGDVRRDALLDDPAALEHDQAVGEHHGLDGVVGDDDRRPAVRGEVPAEVGAQAQPGAGVEGRQRLVEQQQLRREHQRPGERDPLGLPAGQLARPEPGVVGQADPVQPRRRGPAGGGAADPLRAQAVRDVVQRGQVREEQVVLEDDADPAPLRRRPDAGRGVVEHAAAEPDVAAGERHQPGERAQQRRLAGPVRPEHGEDLAGHRVDRGVELEAAVPRQHLGVQSGWTGHATGPDRTMRSRRPTRIATDTSSRTSDSAMAASGSVSSAM